MATSFQTDGAGLWAEQDAGAALDYSLDWGDSLDGGDIIVDSAWEADAGLVIDRRSFTDATTTAWASGGLAGRSYAVRNRITTGTGRVDLRSFRIFVRSNGVGLDAVHSVFPDLPTAIAELRRDRLMGPASAWMAGVELSDEYLLEKLQIAEREVERQLRMFLTPVTIIPETADDAERQALDEAGVRWEEEPGYDHEARLMGGDNWGAVELRHTPVIDVQEVRFAYPDPRSTLFQVPAEWLRLDKKYGRLQLVPTMSTGTIGLSGIILSALNGGRMVPLAIQVRYRAGLRDVRRKHPDLLNVIKRLTVLDVLDDQFMTGQGSISADGLSQSVAWDSGAHREIAAAKIDALRRSLQGIMLAVL
jgi:hypothetical protein